MFANTQHDSCGSIPSESVSIISHTRHTSGYYILRLQTENIATNVKPGQFVQLSDDKQSEMQQPMSIMLADANNGYLDLLYDAKQNQTLKRKQPGERLELFGPVGKPFKLNDYRKRPLLIGSDGGLATMIHLARYIKQMQQTTQPLVLLGSETPFPFTSRPSRFLLPEMPEGVIACMPLLEDLQITSRLCITDGSPGCFDGSVFELTKYWLDQQASTKDIELFCCGPLQLLEMIAGIADTYQLPCEISLLEQIKDTGCIAGPVFNSAEFFAVE